MPFQLHMEAWLTDFLANLVDRVLDRAPVLQRRRPSLFEPPMASSAGSSGDTALPRLEEESRAALTERGRAPLPPSPALRGERSGQPEEKRSSRPDPSRIEDPSLSPSSAEDRPKAAPRNLHSYRPMTGESDPRPNRQAAPNARLEENEPGPREGKQPGRAVHTLVERRIEVVAEQSVEADNRLRVGGAVPMHVPPSSIPRTAFSLDPVRPQSTSVAEIKPHVGTAPRKKESQGVLVDADKSAFLPALLAIARQTTQRRAQSTINASANPVPPPIHVTIGRIEVRATPPATPVRQGRTAGPKLSLDEYLRSRGGGTK